MKRQPRFLERVLPCVIVVLLLSSCTSLRKPEPVSDSCEDYESGVSALERVRTITIPRPLQCERWRKCSEVVDAYLPPWHRRESLLRNLGLLPADYSSEKCDRGWYIQRLCSPESSKTDRSLSDILLTHFEAPPTSGDTDRDIVAHSLWLADLIMTFEESKLSLEQHQQSFEVRQPADPICQGGPGLVALRNFPFERALPYLRTAQRIYGEARRDELIHNPPVSTHIVAEMKTGQTERALQAITSTRPPERIGPLLITSVLLSYLPKRVAEEALEGYLDDRVESSGTAHPFDSDSIWSTKWEKGSDAREFADALCDILELRFGELVAPNSLRGCRLRYDGEPLAEVGILDRTVVHFSTVKDLNDALTQQLGNALDTETARVLPRFEQCRTRCELPEHLKLW